MPERTFQLYEPNRRGSGLRPRVIDIDDSTRYRSSQSVEVMSGRLLVSNEPVQIEIGLSPTERAALSHQVAIGEYLHQRFGSRYPDTISGLVGYDVDDVQVAPIVVTTNRGRPFNAIADQLPLRGEALASAVSKLLVTLEHLTNAQIVHSAISPETVRWDGTTPQVCNLRYATRQGQVRRYHGTSQWSSPEQQTGAGRAHTRDDVYSVGLLLLYIITGEEPRPDVLEQQIANQDVDVQRLLHDAVIRRVSAGRLLNNYQQRSPQKLMVGPPRRNPDLEKARAQFAELRVRQETFRVDYAALPAHVPEWRQEPTNGPAALPRTRPAWILVGALTLSLGALILLIMGALR